MSRSRAATPASKRRRPATKRTAKKPAAAKRAARKPAAKKPAATKRTAKKPAAAKKRTGKKPAAKKRTAKQPAATKRATRRGTTRARAAAKPARSRSAPRKARRATGRRWSRPRPVRALRGAFTSLRWRYRLATVALLGAVVAGGYLFWLRDSSLVAVTDVEVAGVTSGDREGIVSEITRVATGQTTLHADRAAIEKVALAYPTVESVSVDPNFPHGMRIDVVERPPALLVEAGHDQVPAAADGTLLAGVEVEKGAELPVLEINGGLPPGGALEGDPLKQALIAGATPEPLRPMVEEVDYGDEYGVEVTLRGGIPVRFGTGARAAEKWTAAAAVLADPKLTSLTYLDVRVPERPSVADPTA